MTFLIDGYNLMHAVGMAPPGKGAKGFDRARVRFLDWLADTAKDHAAELRIVFDAQSASERSAETLHRGLRVEFSFRETADERIEAIIGADPRPDLLRVVSNDNQVREAARRRECRIVSCEHFVDWLIRKDTTPTAPSSEPDKPAPTATPEETAAWLEAFSRPKSKNKS